MKINELTIVDASERLARKEFSSLELVNACLEQVKNVDGELGAFITVTAEAARETARSVDARRASGETLHPLAGIPIAVKDNILVKGVCATAGSEILHNYTAVYDATVTKKLKEAGACIIGKTNMDEFAMGSSTENSAYKKTKNPWNTAMVPGGSSGGSAVAVAACEALGSLGSDTGGSIRQPAGLTGVVGLKPTYGSVSRYGLIAMASSFDVIGSFSRSVGDARLLFGAISGTDPLDTTSFAPPMKPASTGTDNLRGLRIGVPKEYFVAGLDRGVETVVQQAMNLFKELGAELVEVSLPHTEYGLPVYYILMAAEVSANLSRFDGIRYGHSVYREPDEAVKTLYDVYAMSREQGFGDEVKRRIMLGNYTLSKGYFDAYYKRAASVRELMKRDFDAAFLNVDCILSPTSPTVAWPIGAKHDDPVTMYLSDIFTVSANIAGIPAISIPCGMVDNLPVGLQLMAPLYGEEMLFKVGETYERATEGNKRMPNVVASP